MQNKPLVLCLVIAIFTLAGCDQITDSPAKSTAKKFWQAVQQGDKAIINQYATNDMFDVMDANQTLTLDGDITFGKEINIQENKAKIATAIKAMENGELKEMMFDTMLIQDQDQGQWKVDVSQTMFSMVSSAVSGAMDSLSGELSEQFELSGELFKELFKEGAEEAGNVMLDGLEEFNKALGEIIKEMKQEDKQTDQQ